MQVAINIFKLYITEFRFIIQHVPFTKNNHQTYQLTKSFLWQKLFLNICVNFLYFQRIKYS